MNNTRNLTLSAMFIALGILFPIAFHAIGLGSIFLPMFWPVAAAGFFLPVLFAVLVGILTPILSFFLTGMPPISPPIIYLMISELLVLALITSLFYRYTKLGNFWVLLLGLISSRIALFIAVIPFAGILGLPSQIASFAFVIKGMPGIVLILFFITVLVVRIKHETIWGKRL